MAWRCFICLVFVAVTLRVLMRHIYSEHSQAPNFRIECSVDNCKEKYCKYNSFYRHVIKHHQELLDRSNEIHVNARNLSNNHDQEQADIIQMDTEEVMEIDTEDNPREENPREDNLRGDNLRGDNMEVELDDSERYDTGKAVSFIMNLKEMHRIRETTAEAVANGINGIVQKYIDMMRSKVHQYLQGTAIPEHINELNKVFDVELPFQGVVTSHERKKFIKENFLYVEPELVQVGQRLRVIRRRGDANLDVVRDAFYYVPITQSIEQFLQNEEILELIMQDSLPFQGFFSDIRAGSAYRHNVLFQQNRLSLSIILYFDDVEICNPINKQAGVHKIGIFYYSLANLPVIYRSRLPAIRLLAVIKRNVMNKHGINVVLDRLKTDLEVLSNGITLSINGNDYDIVGSCLCFVGDTLAAHEFGGFKSGVGFAYQKCRSCECTFDEMQTNFEEHLFIQRTLERYDDQCNELAIAQTTAIRDAISRSYGINFRSIARDFPNFNLTEHIPHDIMHVMFEGVAVYEIKLILKVLLDVKLFSLIELNNVIDNFCYGYADRSSRPVTIPAKVFSGNETTLKQSASSMIVLMRLLPFFLIEKLNCDFSNRYIAFLVELCEITLILMSPIISHESVQMLKLIISSHLRKFTNLFPDKNVIPKQHYLIHLPSTIEKFGCLSNVWSMRFESKHNFIKERMTGCHNFKNIEKSISDRCVMYECTLNLCDEHPLFNNDCMYGKTKPVQNINWCKERLSSFFGIDENQITSIHEVGWIIYKGKKFVSDQCEIAFGVANGMPEFGTVKSIWITKERVDESDIQNIYFNIQMFETLNFSEEILSYQVKQPDLPQGNELVYIENMLMHCPLHLYEGKQQNLFIPIPYDLVDVIHKVSNM